MSALSTMARHEFRRSRTGIVVVGVVVGLAGAFALTAAIGAKRAATAWDRFESGTDSPAAFVEAPSLPAGEEALVVARATPGVRAATGFHWLPLALVDRRDGDPGGGEQVAASAGLVVMDDAFGRALYRPRVLEGRLADPGQPDEIVINRASAETDGLAVGDRWAAVAFDATFAPTVEIGLDLQVVGVVEGTIDLGPSSGQPLVYLTPAFRERWLPSVTAAEPFVTGDNIGVPILLATEPGYDAVQVATAVAAASPPGTMVQTGILAPYVETTIGYAAWTLALLAAGAGVAVLVVGTFAMSRLVQPRLAEELAWGAIGATARQRAAVLAGPPLVATVVAVVVATVGAVLATPLVPTGFARRVEIDPGIWVDPLVLVAGVALLGVALALTGTVFAGVARRQPREQVLAQTPAWLTRGTPARTLGVRAALGLGTTTLARRRARAAILTAVVGIVGIAAVVVVGGSTDHALDSPRAWGFGFDRYAGIGDSFTGSVAQPSLEALRASPAVGGLSTVDVNTGFIDGEPVELQQIVPQRGSAFPVLIRGRAPLAPDEVVLGPLALRDHGLDIGERVTLTEGGAAVQIVGSATAPTLEAGEFGYVAWLGAGSFDRLGLEPSGRYLYVAAAPGVTGDELDRIPGLTPPFPPASLTNLRQIGGVPYVLAGFLGLLAAASVAHALFVAVRGRHRELAILRSLGFVGRQVRSIVVWQALAVTLAALVVGLPVGLVTGTWIWRRIATSLGTVLDTSVRPSAFALIAAGAVVVACIVALLPARRAAQLRTADALRTE